MSESTESIEPTESREADAAPRDYRFIRVEPTRSTLGAEISGVDLRQKLSDDVVEEIHAAWLDHLVVFMRDQKLEPSHQAAFGARLGDLDRYPFIEPLADHPAIIPIIKEADNRFNFGGGWHSDTPYQECPPKATMLYAREVPTRGGDTLFADTMAAYESLSQGMRSWIADLRGVYTAAKVHGQSGFYKDADHPMNMTKDRQRVEERYEHPIVRTHPETGRRALYVSLPHIERFVGMTRDESRPMLEFLAKQATRIEFSYRLEWRVGTLALWDNRAVQHYALNDYPGERREAHRLTLKGDRPF